MTNNTVQLLTWAAQGDPESKGRMISSLKDVQHFLKNPLNCDDNVIYGHARGALVAVYVGRKIQNSAVASSFVQDFLDRLDSNNGSSTERAVSQVCGDGRNSDYHLGVAIDPQGNLAWIQNTIRSWAEARCVNETSSEGFQRVEWRSTSIPAISPEVPLKTRVSRRDAGCRRIQAVYGDTLESLALTCRIGTNELRKFNNLPVSWKPEPYHWVCCSKGFAKRAPPNPRPDGSCTSYVTVTDDTCSKIGNTYGITVDDLYTYNKQTWGWGGCDNLFPGVRICLGPGTPRLPAPNSDAECGPSKPGTQSPVNGEKIEDLSPCNIKACCNVWGKCGVDELHCIPTKSETGNPGTAAPHTDGCVQNCGLEMINNDTPPASFMKVAYFESWNRERPCLHMSVSQIPSSYTHIHYAFADITESFGVSTGRFSNVFEEFKAMKGPKRVVAFGGWAFSTEPATYHLFRNAVKSGNRETFAEACVNFVVSNGLDGVDFDWEYPAEPDITPDLIPPGDPEESENYLEFVKVVREKMPADKTVSIAAPASYWYLKQFLIQEMSQVVDYIIYMTYDLHGQWDYGNEWAQPGCHAGNCLRSHVNMTETMSALTMITKAGVQSNKVVVGVTSYGRSFKMTSASCEGPMCTYTGPESGAEHGECTGTGGYISNGEISALIAEQRVSREWTDKTESNYIIYDGNWVAYMDDPNKNSRIEKYRSMNFRGTTDWAVDLQGDVGASDGREVVYLNTEVYSGTPAQCTPPCLFVLQPSGLASATTITLPAYTTSILVAPGTTSTVTLQAPPLTVSSMQYSNVYVSMEQSTGFFWPSVSLDVPPLITTITGTEGVVQTRTLLLPPWPAITRGPPSNWNSTIPDDQWGTTEPVPNPKPSVTWTTPVKPDYTAGFIDTWPDWGEIRPIPEDVPEEGEDDDGDGSKSKSTCKLWFFFVCIQWDDFGVKIGGWEWELPPGIWGPGPPPINSIKLPPGFTIKGILPPWPEITVFSDGKIGPPPKPADCTPAEASLCLTTSLFGTTVSGGATKTTATQVKSTCATITGCNLKNVESTTKTDACTLNSLVIRATDVPLGVTSEDRLEKRVTNRFDWLCDRNGMDAVIWPQNNNEGAQSIIRRLLEERNQAFEVQRRIGEYREFRSDKMDFTAFYWVENLGPKAKDFFASNEVPEVQLVYWPEQTGGNIPNPGDSQSSISKRYNSSLLSKSSNALGGSLKNGDNSQLKKRAIKESTSKFWHLSQISWAPDEVFDRDSEPHLPSQEKYLYSSDDSWGKGQTIYVMENFYSSNPIDGVRVRQLFPEDYGKRLSTSYNSRIHSLLVVGFAAGENVGIARNAEVVLSDTRMPSGGNVPPYWPKERIWENLLLIAEDMETKQRNTGVVNMSFKMGDYGNPVFNQVLTKLMKSMEETYGAMFVCAAGNDPEEIKWYPALASKSLEGMIVVGATDKDGFPWAQNSFGMKVDVDVTAPGVNLAITQSMREEINSLKEGTEWDMIEGTSFATALVSGLVAYIRAHPSYGSKPEPANTKSIIKILRRQLTFENGPGGRSSKMVWNGQRGEDTCSPEENIGLVRRQTSCPLPGGPEVPGGVLPVEFKPGPPGPLCITNCGTLCTGYYCSPNPTGMPPDFGPSSTLSLPDITPRPTTTPQPGEICLSTTTVKECNGGPREAACITTTSCASFGKPDLPSLTTSAPFSPSGGSCVSSTTWTELGGPKFEATITKSSCAVWSTPASPTAGPPPGSSTPDPPSGLPVGEVGCYSSGLAFNSLHGGLNEDITQEVINDINTTCKKAAGKTIKTNEPFWLCTEWEITISDHRDCFEDCIDGCSALSGEWTQTLCKAGCDPNCDPGPTGGYNHIDWAIEIRGDQTEKQITWDICNTAFNTERGGCQQGGQNNHNGFWFRIDPNKGECGSGGAKVKKFVA